MIMPFPPKIPLPIIIEGIKKVIKVGKKVFDILFGDNGQIEKERPLDTKNADTDDIMSLNAILTDYRKDVKSATMELENNIKDICKDVFEGILESLEFVNEQFEFYRINAFKRKINRFTEEIDGIFEKHTAKRISLDDNECIAILKMMPGDLKGKRMKELKEVVFKESIDEIIKKVNDFMNDFLDEMKYSVENKIDGISDKIQEKADVFEELSLDNENKNEMTEVAELYSGYIINLAILVEEI